MESTTPYAKRERKRVERFDPSSDHNDKEHEEEDKDKNRTGRRSIGSRTPTKSTYLVAKELKEKKEKEKEKEKEENNDCGICLDKVNIVKGSLTDCIHIFCFECIHQWSQTSNTCPMCKARFRQIIKTEPGKGRRKSSTKTVKIKDVDQRAEYSDPDPDDFDSDEDVEEDEISGEFDDFIVEEEPDHQYFFYDSNRGVFYNGNSVIDLNADEDLDEDFAINDVEIIESSDDDENYGGLINDDLTTDVVDLTAPTITSLLLEDYDDEVEEDDDYLQSSDDTDGFDSDCMVLDDVSARSARPDSTVRLHSRSRNSLSTPIFRTRSRSRSRCDNAMEVDLDSDIETTTTTTSSSSSLSTTTVTHTNSTRSNSRNLRQNRSDSSSVPKAYVSLDDDDDDDDDNQK
eukprot:TRINITY_DN2660_c0_g2_i1.p1 TRINITY_DN2660_c0_g2~~TRINITY_DN2660_c0_g2_i1.p1  ORF type:complete len:401 (-),score=96.39 TRINITY_DN2660_c0_g2_i1:100-1302(-)